MDISGIGGATYYNPLATSQKMSTAGGAQGLASDGGNSAGGAAQASAAGASSTSSTNSTTSQAYDDPEDLNKDGVVTDAERIQYAMSHIIETQQSEVASIYNQNYHQRGQRRTPQTRQPHKVPLMFLPDLFIPWESLSDHKNPPSDWSLEGVAISTDHVCCGNGSYRYFIMVLASL